MVMHLFEGPPSRKRTDWDGLSCSQATWSCYSVKVFTSFKSTMSDLSICCNKWHHLIPLSIFWGQNLHLSHDMRSASSSVLETSLNLHTIPGSSGGRVRFLASLHPYLLRCFFLSTLTMNYVKVCVLSPLLVNEEVFENKEFVLFTLVAVGLGQCLELQGSRECGVKWNRIEACLGLLNQLGYTNFLMIQTSVLWFINFLSLQFVCVGFFLMFF